MYWIVSYHVFGNCIYAFVCSNMSLCITNVCQWRQYWFQLLRPFYCYSGSHRTSRDESYYLLSSTSYNYHILPLMFVVPWFCVWKASACTLFTHYCDCPGHTYVSWTIPVAGTSFFITLFCLYSEIVAFTGEIKICIKRVYVNKL